VWVEEKKRRIHRAWVADLWKPYLRLARRSEMADLPEIFYCGARAMQAKSILTSIQMDFSATSGVGSASRVSRNRCSLLSQMRHSVAAILQRACAFQSNSASLPCGSAAIPTISTLLPIAAERPRGHPDFVREPSLAELEIKREDLPSRAATTSRSRSILTRCLRLNR
jgi:hypothetical protein